MTDPAAEPDDFPDRPHLRDSRQLTWDRVPATPAAAAAVRDLMNQLEASKNRKRALKTADRERLLETLGAMALDLLVAASDLPGHFLAYSRRDEDYAPATRRYRHPLVTCHTATEAADFLHAAFYADAHAGSFQRRAFGGSGYRSRLRATPKLVAFFGDWGVTGDDVGLRRDAELVRLKGPAEVKGGRKPLLGYRDTSEIERMRSDLRAWTAVAGRHDIRPGITSWTADRAEDDEGTDAGEVIDHRTARLYRVFNNGSWTAGGRFYGGWWMKMPSVARKHITIDGEPVVELDFKALHPRMTYHLQGKPLGPEVDPYDLGGSWQMIDRDAIKVAFNQLLAISPGRRIMKPKGLQLPSKVTYRKLLEALEQKHAPIVPWLRHGRALDLQHLDSVIAEKVLGYFTHGLQRPVLPVHDSFIVAARDENKLGETMMLAYWSTLKDAAGAKARPVIKGWTPGLGIDECVIANTSTLDDEDDDL